MRADLDFASFRQLLNAVTDGVFHQRLQAQAQNRGIVVDIVTGPAYPQALTQARGFNAQIALAQLALLTPVTDRGAVLQVGAKQGGQIFHRPLCLAAVFVDQAGDGVQAVKQKVGPDAGLESLDPGAHFALLAQPQLPAKIEIAQADARYQSRHHEIQQQGAVIKPGALHRAQSQQPLPTQGVSAHQQQHGTVDQAAGRDQRQGGKPVAQRAEQGRGTEKHQQAKQGGQRKKGPVEGQQAALQGAHQQRQQFRQHHQHQQGLGVAEVGQKEIAVCRVIIERRQ